MSKKILNFNELDKVCGGNEYLAIFGFDESSPAAVVLLPNLPLAFNINNEKQIKQIIKGNPSFDGCVNLDENELKKYSWEDIAKWMPSVTTPSLYKNKILGNKFSQLQ